MDSDTCLSPALREEEYKNITKLWRYIILYAFKDAVCPISLELRRKAIAWFINDRWFLVACELADCNARKTRLLALHAIAFHDTRLVQMISKWARKIRRDI